MSAIHNLNHMTPRSRYPVFAPCRISAMLYEVAEHRHARTDCQQPPKCSGHDTFLTRYRTMDP